MLAKSHFVLDKYHLTSRINIAIVYLDNETRKHGRLREVFKNIIEVLENEMKRREI